VPGCEILACVDYASYRPDGPLVSSETRFFMSSIDPGTVTPMQLLKKIRDHWQVENCLHWMKERWWDEDKHYLKWSGDVFIALTNGALSQLKLIAMPKRDDQGDGGKCA